MKRKLAALLAVSLFAVSVPAYAENVRHGQNHDDKCARECSLLLKDCGQEVDSIQDRIKKLQVLIDQQGATTYTQEELKALKRKLAEANETLRQLNKH